jgi:hypothetical protein
VSSTSTVHVIFLQYCIFAILAVSPTYKGPPIHTGATRVTGFNSFINIINTFAYLHLENL